MNAPTLQDLFDIATEADHLRNRARVILADLKGELIGSRVRVFGRKYIITQVSIAPNCSVHCYGVTVSKAGKVGRRGFDLGSLERMEFLP